MITLEASGASPPGTYSPTRSTGIIRWVTTRARRQLDVDGRLAELGGADRAGAGSIATSKAARSSGSELVDRRGRARSPGTRNASGTTWSNRSE